MAVTWSIISFSSWVYKFALITWALRDGLSEDVTATLWQLRGLIGSYGIYVVGTACTLKPSNKRHV